MSTTPNEIRLSKFQTRFFQGLALFGASVFGIAILANMLYRPYDTPEFQEVDTSESAFMIPLEGDTAAQSAFPSIEFLNERKIAAKRVQITHRWQQMGRMPGHGQYLPTVRLIKVDRRPITREWTKSVSSGTSAKDQAISAESRDSINFSMGVVCTANIPEEMAAMYLYTYPSKSLSEMMDMEVRARVQQVLSEESAKYDLFELPKKKNDLIVNVRKDVTDFFKTRGIQITSIGMYGGITFENAEIQKSIDESARASQLKVVAEAKRDAQETENQRLRLEAEAKAEAIKLEAQGRAEAEAVKAEAEAKGKAAVAEAEARGKATIAEAEARAMKAMTDARAYEAEKAAQASSVYVQLRQMELEASRWKQWDGKLPVPLFPGQGMTPLAMMFSPLGDLARGDLKDIKK